MEEKSTPQKLDLLFGRSLFPVAIGLARSEGFDEADIAAIHKQYADHLYMKGEYEPATVNYVKTLGFLQPSYVIRKVFGSIYCAYAFRGAHDFYLLGFSSLTPSRFTTSPHTCKSSMREVSPIPITPLSFSTLTPSYGT